MIKIDRFTLVSLPDEELQELFDGLLNEQDVPVPLTDFLLSLGFIHGVKWVVKLEEKIEEHLPPNDQHEYSEKVDRAFFKLRQRIEWGMTPEGANHVWKRFVFVVYDTLEEMINRLLIIHERD